MRCLKNFLVVFMSLVLTTSCGQPNVLTEFSQTDSDEALFVEAQKKIDNLEWQAAIDIIENEISDGYRVRSDVVEALAGAYVGKCGLTFLELVSGMTNSPSSNLFPYFMGIFKNMTLDPDSCETAIGLIESFGTVSQRTQDQNLFLAILGIARLGVTLSYKLDQVDHDGLPDASYSVCEDYTDNGDVDALDNNPSSPWVMAPLNIYKVMPRPLPAPTHFLNDADMRKVVAGLGLVLENMTALGAAIGGNNSVITSLESFKTQCQAQAGVSCEITKPADVNSDLMKYAFRLFLDTSDVGFGTCSLSTPLPDGATIAAAVAADVDDDDDAITKYDGDTDINVTGICCPARMPPGYTP